MLQKILFRKPFLELCRYYKCRNQYYTYSEKLDNRATFVYVQLKRARQTYVMWLHCYGGREAKSGSCSSAQRGSQVKSSEALQAKKKLYLTKER